MTYMILCRFTIHAFDIILHFYSESFYMRSIGELSPVLGDITHIILDIDETHSKSLATEISSKIHFSGDEASSDRGTILKNDRNVFNTQL